MKTPVFPSRVEDITPELLTEVLAKRRPGVKVEGFDIIEVKRFGEGIVSTADRVAMQLRFAPGCQSDLPNRIIIKTMLISPHAPAVMYLNEVRFYQEIQPLLYIETPQCYGGAFDKQTGQFGVILEDLRARSASFPNATTPISLSIMEGVSSRFPIMLSWMSTVFAISKIDCRL